MSARVRLWTFAVAALVMGGLLAWGLFELPPAGTFASPYGERLTALGLGERHADNVVTAVLFDLRSIDSLGEELILFTAVAGVALLLRPLPGEQKEPSEEELPEREAPPTSAAVRVVGFGFAAVAGLYGLLLVARGHLSPGGGFQGGVLAAGAVMLLYLVSDYDAFSRRASLPLVQLLEGTGVAAYSLVGLAGMLWGPAFLANVLPAGRAGDLLSAGVVPLLSVAVGLAVGGGSVLLVVDFLEQTLVIRAGRWWR